MARRRFQVGVEPDEKFRSGTYRAWTGGTKRLPIDDGTVAIIDYQSGAQGVLQTSFIAVGNYPGIEIRIYGSKGAAIGRLVVENGIAETLHLAKADAVEFQQIHLPADRYPPGATVETPWPQLYYRQLVRDWTDEDSGRPAGR